MTDQPKKDAFFSQWDERLSKLLRDYKDYSSSDSRQKSYSEFLGASFREIMILHEDFVIYKYPTVERAIQSLLRGSRMVDEKRFEPDGRECIPRYVPMEADGGSVDPVLAEGIRYYENVSDGRKLIIRIELLEDPEGIEFMARAWFVIKREEMEFLRTLLQEIGDWVKKHHHLKQACAIQRNQKVGKRNSKYPWLDCHLRLRLPRSVDIRMGGFKREKEPWDRLGEMLGNLNNLDGQSGGF